MLRRIVTEAIVVLAPTVVNPGLVFDVTLSDAPLNRLGKSRTASRPVVRALGSTLDDRLLVLRVGASTFSGSGTVVRNQGGTLENRPLTLRVGLGVFSGRGISRR